MNTESLTIQKLRRCLRELELAVTAEVIPLAPVLHVAASAPMALPAADSDVPWCRLEPGQAWGEFHGTTWLKAEFALPPAGRLALPKANLPDEWEYMLGLAWDGREDDHLLLKLEATVFLNAVSIGALDWRHHELLVPSDVCDGRTHQVYIQVYTRAPLPFDGLYVRVRYGRLWRLYQCMYSMLQGLQTLGEHEVARHMLLEQLNTAYAQLDLREGWQAQRLRDSAYAAFDYLHHELSLVTSERNRPTVTISGHAHLDVGWRWPYWRSHQKIAHTIANVLALMERYPEYHYSQSQPQLLQWLKEDMPELYQRVRQRVREGRFEPVGAMWVEADCNLPSGESFIRQILHGIRFWQEEFGVTPRQIWLPDVFGYSAALPQIMRGCTISTFMTTKISWNQWNRMPNDTFRWRGIDGSEVLAHFITAPDEHEQSTYYTYNGPLHAADLVKTWTNYRQQAINTHLLYLCGWGDGGGGVTEEQLEQLQTLQRLPGSFPNVQMGRVDSYFTALYEQVWEHPGLPTWVGELYLEYHRGTYTSQAYIKRANRHVEFYLRECEWLSAWASLYGMPSRKMQLQQAWRLILLNQFHDVLPGSSIHEVYEDAQKLYTQARILVTEIRDEALRILRTYLLNDTLLLMNTLPWTRQDALCLPSERFILDRQDGQVSSDWDGTSLVLLDNTLLPSYSLSKLSGVFVRGMQDESATCACETNEAGELVLHNKFYSVVIADNGEIRSLYDKRVERNILQVGLTGNQLIAYEDRPLNYDAWDIDLYYEEKPYPIRTVALMQVIENGPVRVTVEVTRYFQSSRISQRISLWRRSPRIDFATDIDWHENHMLLKAAFPVAINSAQATYEIQFGHVERPTHRNTSWDLARFEVCAHRWADLSEGAYGVSLLNDGKYGHDIHDQVMRLTLLKSATDPDPQADQGVHRFTYSLLPHVGGWREAGTVQHAYELNVPTQLLYEDNTQCTPAMQHAESTMHSFLWTDCPHVVVETVKPAEDGDGLIIRLYESYNQHGQGTLHFALPLLQAQECNLLEEPQSELACQGQMLSFQVRPFEIKTLRVHLRPEG